MIFSVLYDLTLTAVSLELHKGHWFLPIIMWCQKSKVTWIPCFTLRTDSSKISASVAKLKSWTSYTTISLLFLPKNGEDLWLGLSNMLKRPNIEFQMWN